jgi:hypothetical protein
VRVVLDFVETTIPALLLSTREQEWKKQHDAIFQRQALIGRNKPFRKPLNLISDKTESTVLVIPGNMQYGSTLPVPLYAQNMTSLKVTKLSKTEVLPEKSSFDMLYLKTWTEGIH